jgi:uncharacterized iron-regulated membrane protein
MAATTQHLRIWFWIHRWSSLICTAFLLLLCLTGLPLIFHEEIDAWTGEGALPAIAANTPPVSVDRLVAAARRERPADVPMYLYWDPEEHAKAYVTVGPSPSAETGIHVVNLDGRTGNVLHTEDVEGGIMYILFKLHVDLFAGVPGMLLIGVMGLLLLASIVSGVVLYAPFMRKLVFGTVRREKSRRLYWLDLHNLLGIATAMWLFVVGGTGVINSFGQIILMVWQSNQLADMTAAYTSLPPPRADEIGSLQRALETAQRAVPDMQPRLVAFPGTPFSSAHHYAVFMAGATPLTSRLLKPALVDAKTAQLTATRNLPWYMTAVLVSRPLHFGDYGGLPLKIAWALMDAVAIVVLGTGVYLWFGRRARRLPFEAGLAESTETTADEPAQRELPAAAAEVTLRRMQS